MDTSEYDSKIGSARKSFSGMADAVSAKAVAMGTMVAHGLEKAASAAVGLGKSAVTAAAEVAAEQAQFTATFGELQGSAEKAFDRISKSTGIFGTRLQNVGTKAFSQFKGAGLDAVDALGSMETYTNLAADAAAYYDISLEDADARLRSFLRGNTEAGDAIGLFTSESQRNTYAMEKYGAKWTELTEAQKQMLMLDVAQDIYEQSGAIGQAARESDNWTNVVGNLKEVWRQTLAVVGEPVMETLTPVIQKLTEFLQDENVQLKLEQFGITIANIANATFDKAEAFLGLLTTEGTGENTLIDGVSSFANSIIKLGSATIDNALGFVKGLSGLLGIEGSSDFFGNAGTFFADLGTFATEHAETIGGLITALTVFMGISNPFALFIAALATIIGNWEDIKTTIDNCKTAFDNFVNAVVPDEYLSAAKAGWNSLIEKIQTAITAVRSFFGITSEGDPTNPNNPYGTNYHGSGVSGFGGGSSSGTGAGRGFATGLDYVPYNEFPARLHEGEAVLTKAEASAWRAGGTGGAVINEASLASTIAAAVADALGGAFVNMDGERVGQVVLPTVSRGIAQGARSKRYATV